MTAFAPEKFSNPPVSPDTASLFRRTPYVSTSEYQATPTAVAIGNLVPGGSAEQQQAALAAVISRASDYVDTLCFHRADGTLAASPATESGWIRPKDNGTLQLICNYKPVLEVDGVAIGAGPGELSNIGDTAAEAITIQGRIIQIPGGITGRGPVNFFPTVRTTNGKVYVVWVYVNGFPHNALAAESKKGATKLTVSPSVPAGSAVCGVYPGTMLTIHDGASTEVVVVNSVEGFVLNLAEPLKFDHKVPPNPDTVRVSAVPWIVEQACISLTSYLIKTRGTRAMVIPQSPSKAANPPKQVGSQAGGSSDYDAAVDMLKPFKVSYMRST